MDTRDALITAIDIAGSQTRLAKLLTEQSNRLVSQAHIATWLRRGRAAGPMCGYIEAVTGVSKKNLRPDLFYEVA